MLLTTADPEANANATSCYHVACTFSFPVKTYKLKKAEARCRRMLRYPQEFRDILMQDGDDLGDPKLPSHVKS